MENYIRYHKKPFAKYLTVGEFNSKFGHKIEVSTTFDNAFESKYRVARNRSGHDEYITTGLTIEAGKTIETSTQPIETSTQPTSTQPIETSTQPTSTAAEDLDEFLGRETQVDQVSAVEEIVLERAKDAKTAKLDLKNIVHFKQDGAELKDRLMKGTKSNLISLKNYYKGDKDATVRMSYKDGNKETKVSSLNPNKDSLKQFLTNTKGIREVLCG